MDRSCISCCLVIALITLICVFPATASGQSSIYMSFKPGAFFPKGDIEDVDTGFSGKLAFGHQYNENFAIEMSVGWTNLDETWRDSGMVEGVVYTGRVSADIDIIPVALNFKPIIPFGNWELYGLIGVGPYFVKASADVLLTVDDMTFRSSGRESDTVFGFTAGLGLQYNFTPRIFAGAEAKYLFTSDVEMFGNEFNLNGIWASGVVGFRF
jgi:opacity protein-like surface antigen